MAPKPITLEGNRGNRRDCDWHIAWIDRPESAADIVELLIAIALAVLCASALGGWFLLGWRRGLSGLGCGRLGGRQGEFDAIFGLLGHQAIFDPVENLLVPGILRAGIGDFPAVGFGVIELGALARQAKLEDQRVAGIDAVYHPPLNF